MNWLSRDGEPGWKSGSDKVRSIFDAANETEADKRVEPAHIALVGNFSPRKCGIATFTTDIFEQLRDHHPEITVDVHALDDPAYPLAYQGIAGTIACNDPEDYARAARQINESGVDAVWLQHEYGIFGGEDGEMVCHFVDRLAAPLIVTLHTVLLAPTVHQRVILEHLAARASRIMVMSRYSRDLLQREYNVPAGVIEVIEHGAPDRPFGRQEHFKAQLGLTGRKVLMSFGLLCPDKGLEHAIAALPAIVAEHPEVLYRIVGATHPNLVATEGEAYREKLEALAAELGVSDHIAWDNRFLETSELLDQLEACDIYMTPYPGLQQSTSGTLSYAVALGKALVSTPYVHARELLGNSVGMLIEPGSSTAIADAVTALLGDEEELAAMQRRAWARGREMIWPRFAESSARLIAHARAPRPAMSPVTATPGLSAVFAMSDATGMLQHSIGVVPDRRHGYCLDDNARALMLMNVAEGLPAAERMKWSLAYAGFVQYAWNADLGRFRNFMRYDRSWCEDEGSEDSNGRALWALGQTRECVPDHSLGEWALDLFEQALGAVDEAGSPRAVAFAMLGACAVLRRDPSHAAARARVESGGDFLMKLLGHGRRPDWAWFEAVLGYDNPRLPQALIEAGMALGREDWIGDGLATLEWICHQQVSARGQFRPIGSESFHKPYSYLPFDQQPLEAQAAIEASRTAWRATHGAFWREHALAAWRWFFGGNDRGVVLADLVSGRCRDGVTPRGVNGNCGAESVLAFQLSHYAMAELAELGPLASTGPLASGGGWLEPARDSLV
ncbi:glycosyltransferase involved in cell wall biosynthesis [Novosphingobium sp. PhB165]|uniref:glycosyltransferase family 4 protein n=1 Tax=Novosphingobium sp. PhB165 TaxID=2485105 RepID=UPI001042C121|nr:glycosyltransferase family 4 protein [Novosphingobium sp. PhB165]TCM17338.1 glycosyltransferase involved in cell wall biosynthesis [Novosphingobium sp. PhB165]